MNGRMFQVGLWRRAEPTESNKRCAEAARGCPQRAEFVLSQRAQSGTRRFYCHKHAHALPPALRPQEGDTNEAETEGDL